MVMAKPTSSRLGNNHPLNWVGISGFCRPSRLSHPCASAGYSHLSLEAIVLYRLWASRIDIKAVRPCQG